ncbi:MAG: hypothetical protein HQK52_12855 [Oligoflexia bacterium]|nr:hypothetical protein [Oligoflexia bacterium]
MGHLLNMFKLSTTLLIALIPFSLSMLTSCGGGGGSAGSGGNTTEKPDDTTVTNEIISYEGLTTKASIDTSNAEELVISSLQAGSTTSVVKSAVRDNENDDSNEKQVQIRPLSLSQALEEDLSKIDLTSYALSSVKAKNASNSKESLTLKKTISGSCGGDSEYEILISQNSNSEALFSGTYNYHDYCSRGTTLNGSVIFSGKISNQDITEFKFSFISLSSRSDDDHFVCSGNISFANSLLMATMIFKDNNNGKIHKIENFKIKTSIPLGKNYTEITLEGTFYHSDYGYVTLSTLEPLRYYARQSFPALGSIVIEGKDSLKVKLSFTSSNRYLVEGDFGGDGVYAWNSGTQKWCYDCIEDSTEINTTDAVTNINATESTAVPTPAIKEEFSNQQILELINGLKIKYPCSNNAARLEKEFYIENPSITPNNPKTVYGNYIPEYTIPYQNPFISGTYAMGSNGKIAKVFTGILPSINDLLIIKDIAVLDKVVARTITISLCLNPPLIMPERPLEIRPFTNITLRNNSNCTIGDAQGKFYITVGAYQTYPAVQPFPQIFAYIPAGACQ